jgi:hypothetical protein
LIAYVGIGRSEMMRKKIGPRSYRYAE